MEISNEVFSSILSWLILSAFKVIISLAVLLVSFKVVNAISRKIEGTGNSGKLDKTIAKTLAYLFKLAMKLAIILCLIGFIGVDTSGFAALLVSVGAGIGLWYFERSVAGVVRY